MQADLVWISTHFLFKVLLIETQPVSLNIKNIKKLLFWTFFIIIFRLLFKMCNRFISLLLPIGRDNIDVIGSCQQKFKLLSRQPIQWILFGEVREITAESSGNVKQRFLKALGTHAHLLGSQATTGNFCGQLSTKYK